MTSKPMRLVMISDLETQGGAAVAASRLATQLVHDGHDVTRIVRLGSGHGHPWKTEKLEISINERRAIRLVPPRFQGAFAETLLARRLSRLLAQLRPEIINVHNIHGGASEGWGLRILTTCAVVCPVVWTLHDMWSFTGRCAYAWDCKLFQSGCDHTCPTHAEYPTLDRRLIASQWRRRRKVFRENVSISAVTPSDWLRREALRGIWPGNRVECIPYGLPLNRFKPEEQRLARQALNIETTKPVLLACAEDWRERRKGGSILEEALTSLPVGTVHLVTLGAGHLDVEGHEIHELGFVDHERTRVLAFSAADLFLHPAPVDNLPNVVIEAIACGTPVVGLPIGGVPEMVRPGVTGWLATDGSGRSLAAAISIAISDKSIWGPMRASCRSFAENNYDASLQARRYVELFDRLRSEFTISGKRH